VDIRERVARCELRVASYFRTLRSLIGEVGCELGDSGCELRVESCGLRIPIDRQLADWLTGSLADWLI
jgi:hypothetical protein